MSDRRMCEMATTLDAMKAGMTTSEYLGEVEPRVFTAASTARFQARKAARKIEKLEDSIQRSIISREQYLAGRFPRPWTEEMQSYLMSSIDKLAAINPALAATYRAQATTI